jgi:hypothetical protein
VRYKNSISEHIKMSSCSFTSQFYNETLWPAVFSIARAYNASLDSQNAFTCFVYSLGKILPEDIGNEITFYSITIAPMYRYLSSSEQLLKWCWGLHNAITTHLTNKGIKGLVPISLSDVYLIYNPTNMTKAFWGRPTWKLIHSIASLCPLNYDKNVFTSFKAFMTCLTYLLPCRECRLHLTENLSQLPIDNYLKSRNDVFYWSYLLHQTVNKRLNKKGISYNEALKLYNL